MKLRILSPAALLALAVVAAPAAAQVANGSFETGDLTGWTAGGTARVAVVQNVNFRTAANAAAAMPPVPNGTRFAALSTGPDTISNTTVGNIDGNAYNDFDMATLNGTIVYSGRPAVLVFDWNFASSERSQSTPYDDYFDVRISNSHTVLSGSAAITSNNDSPFPDVAVTGLGNVNWTMNAGVLNGVSLTQGVGAWNRACVPIPTATAASYSLPVSFRVFDQRDSTVDTVLLIDNVRVQGACDVSPGADVTQVTATTGSQTTVKGGGFVFTPAQARLVAANRSSGAVRIFGSSANVTGDNPNVITQPFLRTSTGYSRLGSLTVSAGGTVQAVNLSDNGNWAVVAVKTSEAENLEIYRYQISTGTLTRVTTTANCENRNPSINDAGTLLVFESTCNAITGQGTARKVVYTRFATPTVWYVLPAGNCTSRNPSLSTDGRYIGMESVCNPPGRSNSDANVDLFVFDTTSNQITTDTRWRQVTLTTGAATNFSLSLSSATGNFNTLEAVLISSASLVGSTNTDGTTEVFRWVGNNTTSNNGTLTQVTTNSTTGKYYTQALLASANDYFSFERLDAVSGTVEVGAGLSTAAGGNVTAVTIGGTFLGLGVAEDATNVYVPFVAAEDITGGNADGNYEVFQGRVAK